MRGRGLHSYSKAEHAMHAVHQAACSGSVEECVDTMGEAMSAASVPGSPRFQREDAGVRVTQTDAGERARGHMVRQ